MPDDQVTIDPEFAPPPPRLGQIYWVRLGVVAAATVILGWLLLSPTSVGSPPSVQREAAQTSTSTTTLTRETTPTPPTTVAAMVGLTVPLGEAVPGFDDIITLAVSNGIWGEEGVDVFRWWPSRAAPEMILTLPNEPLGPLADHGPLDAAGIWYANHEESGALSVLRPTAVAEDAGWWEPSREAVGLRVVDFAWHETESGRLAWLSCPRAPGGPGTLYTLDVADRAAEPVPVVSLPYACREVVEAWLSKWGDWGFALGRVEAEVTEDGWQEDRVWTLVLDPSGGELAQFVEDGPEGATMVGAGPSGTIWTNEPVGDAPSSFVLSLDGQRRSPVPGLADGEWVDGASWSPDGSRIALLPFSGQMEYPSIRVVDAATGETLTEIDEPDSDVWQTCWSSAGRFLLYWRDRGGEGPVGAELVVYDTVATAIASEVPLGEHHGLLKIRTADPATATQLAPVEWSIALDDAGSGVHTIYMIADVNLLALDQAHDLSGRLIWDETVVDLCGIGIRNEGEGYLAVGDIFQTTEGCGSNPTAMQDAFDEFGLPEAACLALATDRYDREYCAPLS